jgi:Complex 1 protein (LYR family)
MNPIQTRREVLALWRDVLRTSRAFYWSNDNGIPWCRVLRESARKEFEAAKKEKDPVIIMRLLVVGRQCVDETKRRFNAVEDVIKKRIDNTRIRS